MREREKGRDIGRERESLTVNIVDFSLFFAGSLLVDHITKQHATDGDFVRFEFLCRGESENVKGFLKYTVNNFHTEKALTDSMHSWE